MWKSRAYSYCKGEHPGPEADPPRRRAWTCIKISCSLRRRAKLPETWKFKDTRLLWLHQVENRDNPHLPMVYRRVWGTAFIYIITLSSHYPSLGGVSRASAPPIALAEILRSQGASLQGGREEAFSPSTLTPCPLHLAGVHPASRGLGWAVRRESGWHQGCLVLGVGPGWIVFLAAMGLHIHSSPPCKLEMLLRWASVYEHICGGMST